MAGKKQVTYVGFLGHNSLGDEALYLVNQQLFHPYQLRPSYGDFIPCSHSVIYGNSEQYSAISLFGGGTVLPHWLLIVLPNKYSYAYGVGVQDPSFWGYSSFAIAQIRKFNFRYLGVRDNFSERMLKSWGIKSEVIGDPCLLLDPSRSLKREHSRIAINVGSGSPEIWGRNEERVFSEISKLCRALRTEGYDPILIPFDERNYTRVEEIARMTRVGIFRHWKDIQAVVDIIATSRVLVEERLHSLVFSAAVSTPFVSVEYRPKCCEFAESVGFEQYNIRTSEVTCEEIMKRLNSILNNWSELHKSLMKNVWTLRERLYKASQRIKSDIDSLPDDKWIAPKWQIPKLFYRRYVQGRLARLTSTKSR